MLYLSKLKVLFQSWQVSAVRSIFPCLLVILGAITLPGCDGASFTQVVDVDLATPDPIPVMLADWSTEDTTLRVFITETVGVLSDTLAPLKGGASVELFINGLSVGAFAEVAAQDMSLDRPSDNDRAIVYELTTPGQFVPGAEIRLVATLADGRVLQAQDQLPLLSNIEAGDYTAPTRDTVDFGNGGFSISSRGGKLSGIISDRAGEANFYQFFVEVAYYDSTNMSTTTFRDRLFSREEDTRWTPTESGQILRDVSFDGQRIEIDFDAAGNDFGQFRADSVRAFINYESFSQASFLYLRDSRLASDAEFNPFAEPVVLSSNIEGGLGVLQLRSIGIRSEIELD